MRARTGDLAGGNPGGHVTTSAQAVERPGRPAGAEGPRLPGIGVLLGAEFLAATGGDLDRFGSADQLAGFAGVIPMPRDPGHVNGNLHRRLIDINPAALIELPVPCQNSCGVVDLGV